MKRNLIIQILIAATLTTSLCACGNNKNESKDNKTVAKVSNSNNKKTGENSITSKKKDVPFYDYHGNNLYGPLKYDAKQASDKKLRYIEIYNYCEYIYNHNYTYKNLIAKYVEYCEKNKDKNSIEFDNVLKNLDKEILDKCDEEERKRKDAGMRIKALIDKTDLNWDICKEFQNSNSSYIEVLNQMKQIKDPKKIIDVKFGEMIDYARDDQGKTLDKMRNEIDKMV